MDADQAKTLDQVRDELRALREQLDRIEATITGRGGDTAAPAVSDEVDLARRAIAWMARHNLRHRLLSLDHDLLVEFCHRLQEPGTTAFAAIRWLNDRAGNAVSQSAAYRFVQEFRDIADALEAGGTPSRRDVDRTGGSFDRAAILAALAQVARGSRNRLLELPHRLLAEALERAGLHKSATRSREARRWLAERTGREINNNAFHCLRKSVLSAMRPPHRASPEAAEGGAR